jgi:hypothetical protein
MFRVCVPGSENMSDLPLPYGSAATCPTETGASSMGKVSPRLTKFKAKFAPQFLV